MDLARPVVIVFVSIILYWITAWDDFLNGRTPPKKSQSLLVFMRTTWFPYSAQLSVFAIQRVNAWGSLNSWFLASAGFMKCDGTRPVRSAPIILFLKTWVGLNPEKKCDPKYRMQKIRSGLEKVGLCERLRYIFRYLKIRRGNLASSLLNYNFK